MTEGKNRRTTFRKAAVLPLTVFTLSDRFGGAKDFAGARFIGFDLSEGGLGLETLFPVEAGDVLGIGFEISNPPHPIRVDAIVKNVTTERRGKHEIRKAGLEFFKIAAADRHKIALFVKEATFVV
ncbi:MAG: PilZ domain-containing protein [Bdellovibrionota bacterium]